MTEWFDPRIVVAIGTGFIGALSGIGSLIFSVHVFRKQEKRNQNRAAWEEYRETVYDPLHSDLRDMEGFAKRCRRTLDSPHEEHEWIVFSRQLSEKMNEIEIACAKADQHEASICTDWAQLAENKNQEIHHLINEYDLDKGVQLAESDLEILRDRIQTYVKLFDDRLRVQRRTLLDF